MTAANSLDIVNYDLPLLVRALPEMYQPIYGHPELTGVVSRACDDRLAYIEVIWRNIGRALGRPPRVLDLGCAQGYISLRLAALSAPVLGIDHSAENIALCRALANEHPEWNAQFRVASIEKLFDEVDLNQIDIVLGLSVFHHMARAHGYEAVSQWLTTMGANVAACIFELALASEPVHWASAQPADERYFLKGFAFRLELARLPTHLSSIERPLIFASNYLWHLGGNVDHFNSMSRSSHDGSLETCGGTRIYYMNERSIAKVYSLRDAFPVLNRSEVINEATFLCEPPEGFQPVPKLYAYGVSDREVWLVRERLPGELLYDQICAGRPYDAQRVIGDILKQLAALEAKALYHNDVMTWNVLIALDGSASLIDYGSISASSESFSWPTNLFSSWWLFVWCVTARSKWSGKTNAPPFASPYNLPAPFAAWAHAFSRIPVTSWTFDALLLVYKNTMSTNTPDPALTATDLWQRSAETYFMGLTEKINTIYDTFIAEQSSIRSE